ncbi:MAG: hypothetical protein QM426_01905 [Euryarchaeota archaeon]|nr:hypothetical protein [Euryarchaeota archaeon]
MKKSETLLITLLLFFGVLMFPASADDSVQISPESNNSEKSEISNVYFDYYTYFFGLYSQGNNVITRYGKLPVLDAETQKENWNSTLEELSNKIKDTVVSKYMYPHGEVMSCGINAKGYFVILFKYGNVDKQLMDEIYSLIDNSAEKMGIQDVPVEFGYGTYRDVIYLDGINRWYWFGESTENLSEDNIYTLEEVMKHRTVMPVQKTVAVYGNIPLLKDKNETISWVNELSEIANATEEKITPYIEQGQVIKYATGIRLEVEINETLSPEEKIFLAEEIYQTIDQEARKQNVNNVPVIFMSTSEEGIKGSDNSNNNSESGSGSSSGRNDSNKNNSIPGFGLLGSLACLCGGWKLKKR